MPGQWMERLSRPHLARWLVWGTICLAAALPAQGASSTPLAEVSISRVGGMVLVPVYVEGKRCTFVLDTGMTHTALDNRLVRRMGSPVEHGLAMTPAGPMGVDFYRAGRMSLAGLAFRLQVVSSMEMGPFRRVLGRKIDGFVGMDFLKDYVVQLDWSAGKLRLYAPDASGSWGTATPLGWDMGVPTTQVRLGGRTDTFIVDTGCNLGGCLREGLYGQTLRTPSAHHSGRIIVTAAAGTIRSRQVKLDSVAVGSVASRNLSFGYSRYNLLGLGFLSRQTLTMDFPKGVMYLRAPYTARTSSQAPARSSKAIQARTTKRNAQRNAA